MRHPLAPLVAAGALAGLLVPASLALAKSGPKPVTRHAKAGPYEVTLKVLPPEAFKGPHAEMAWDGGAKATTLTSAARPNRHLVAFVTLKGKPVTDAKVAIRYRMTGMRQTRWITLPVARMHVAGKGTATTHYGNNVHLRHGWYQAVVTVDGHRTKVLSFAISAPRHERMTDPPHRAGHGKATSG